MAKYNERMNIIAIDIGNSSINIGFFTAECLLVQKIDTYPLMASSDYAKLINEFIEEKNIDKKSQGVIISSVVPGHTAAIREACKILSKKEPLMVSHNLKTGISFQIKEPEKLGTDRIAACAAACDLFGIPAVVIDFGTATTLNFIGSGNVYKGGAIMPGVWLMKNALSVETAQLPDIAIPSLFSKRQDLLPLGRDTKGCILSGIIYGTAGAVERIVAEVEAREGESFKVIVTGGYSELITPFIKKVDYVEPDLVLNGLKVIYERNA